MKKLKIANKHEAGVFDFIHALTKGIPTIPAEKAEDFKKFKEKAILLYKRLNNAYRIYFQGAKLKQKQQYTLKKYKDKNGNIKQKKVLVETPSSKIDFQGKWGFQLADGKTYLGQAIHALHKFVTTLENTKVNVSKDKQPQQKQPVQQEQKVETQEQKQTPAEGTPK